MRQNFCAGDWSANKDDYAYYCSYCLHVVASCGNLPASKSIGSNTEATSNNNLHKQRKKISFSRGKQIRETNYCEIYMTPRYLTVCMYEAKLSKLKNCSRNNFCSAHRNLVQPDNGFRTGLFGK